MMHLTQIKNRIEINPQVLVGKPLIKGSRIAVEFIIELLANGWTYDQILKNYPKLKKEDIRAALEYSASALKFESTYSI